MNKQFLTLLLLLPLISATIYAGGTYIYPNEMEIENLVYAVVGNSSPINVVVTINSTTITIFVPGDATPDNFELVFIENTTNTITNTITQTIHVGGGGGGSRTVYQNQTEYVGVPKFYDRNITVIEYVNQTIDDEEQVNNSIGWFIIISGLIILATIFIILFFQREPILNNYSIERRENNNE